MQTFTSVNFSTIMWLIFVIFSEIKTGSDIHVPLRMNCNNSGDPLTFHQAPVGQSLFL